MPSGESTNAFEGFLLSLKNTLEGPVVWFKGLCVHCSAKLSFSSMPCGAYETNHDEVDGAIDGDHRPDSIDCQPQQHRRMAGAYQHNFNCVMFCLQI